MPASGKTALQLYRSNTAGTRPASLSDGEAFINQADGIICWRNSSGNVVTTPLDQYLILANDYTNTTTTLSNLFQFSAVASAIYEYEMLMIYSISATSAAMKLALTSPSGCIQSGIIAVTPTATGTSTPTFLELGTSGTAQSGPAPLLANSNGYASGTGLIINGTTAGPVTVQASLSAAATLTVKAGSLLKYRRIK